MYKKSLALIYFEPHVENYLFNNSTSQVKETFT